MTAQNRTTLKGYFNTGDVPTEAQFADLIDSFPTGAEDGADVTDADSVTAALLAKANGSEGAFVAGASDVTIASVLSPSGAASRFLTLDSGGAYKEATYADAKALLGVDTWAVTLEVFRQDETVIVGDGAARYPIPSVLNGMNLVGVAAQVVNAGSGGSALNIQVRNTTAGVDMLSTPLTIDNGETTSGTAATAAVIDTAADGVTTFDMLRIDIDAVPTDPPDWLGVTLYFKAP